MLEVHEILLCALYAKDMEWPALCTPSPSSKQYLQRARLVLSSERACSCTTANNEQCPKVNPATARIAKTNC
jgi:hypothetical protein